MTSSKCDVWEIPGRWVKLPKNTLLQCQKKKRISQIIIDIPNIHLLKYKNNLNTITIHFDYFISNDSNVEGVMSRNYNLKSAPFQ